MTNYLLKYTCLNLSKLTSLPISSIRASIPFIYLALLAISVLMIVATWKIFSKAGEEGWKSLIPIYNIITFLKIINLNPLLVIVYFTIFIPIIGMAMSSVMSIIATIYLGKSFKKNIGFIFGLILLPPIFLSILAFGDSEYVGTPYLESEL